MTLKEIEKKVLAVIETIHGNGKKGLKSEVEILKTNFKFFWALMGLLLGLNGVILGILLKEVLK
jgi:hypothetical protein